MSCLSFVLLSFFLLLVVYPGACRPEYLEKELQLNPTLELGLEREHVLDTESSISTQQNIIKKSRTKRSKVKLCGDILIEMLRVVCRHRGRRDVSNQSFWLSNREEVSNFAANRGVGLAESCCQNSCSIRQLQRACGLIY
ncbi:uncharacterized protein LOC111704221 [Eurytemora carolleeae]|uniref:uncharacterized protein LOC111704221 n=1 Tax=Eurytemora carolleeae TaxID=1294199 RepID=UPI000C790886|nr:uncharacterized protein LOC111704221 [Eurytemora carolleeae]|eukprot:XP_023332142.1 uncharacterized protein LOC111704221 [Eurytemora affinis]